MIFLVLSVEQKYVLCKIMYSGLYLVMSWKHARMETTQPLWITCFTPWRISCWKRSLYPVWTSLVSAYVSCFSSSHQTALWMARLHNFPMGPEGCSGWCYPQAASYPNCRRPVPSACPAGECPNLWPAWWPSPGFAAVYQCLFCIGAAKSGHSIHTKSSKCWAEGDNPFPLYTHVIQAGYCWPALLPGYTAGLCPACCLPRPPGCFQQSCSPISQYPACIFLGSFFPSAGLILVKFHKVPLGPFFQPVYVPLNGSFTSKYIDCLPQLVSSADLTRARLVTSSRSLIKMSNRTDPSTTRLVILS